MKNATASFVIFLLLCAAVQVNGQKPTVGVSALPAWVKPVSIKYNLPKLEKQSETGYFDIAFIEQVHVPEQTVYIRKALKLMNEEGVEYMSEISVAYNQAYQKLSFHDIHVIRNGQNIEKLKRAKFKSYPHEEDLYMQRYNNNVTAYVDLADVQVGDIIEYAYSIKGFNPLFENRYAENFTTAFDSPVGTLLYRLITNADSPIYIEHSGPDVAAEEYRNGNLKEYQWLFTEVPGITIEADVPSWYEPYPAIMVSEYNDWLNIRDFSARLFANNVTVEKGLQKNIDSIKQSNTTNDTRAAAALRFVQEDIKYVDVDMWTGSRKPADPNKTFAQGYGDRKDKAYLLVTMLGAMNIDATPVLVNTSVKQSIAKNIPSPQLFNHVTVRMKINGGQYFVDPTNAYQRGSLDVISFPDYQKGLVLADSISGITTISPAAPGMVSVKEKFVIRDMKGHATLMVTTINTGSFADNARATFKNGNSPDVQKTFEQFYSAYFKNIKSDTIYYQDDEQTGSFTVNELYTIDSLWALEDGIKTCGFYAFVINSYLTRPPEKLRTMPIAMFYPAKLHEEVEVQLPEDWSIRGFDREVNGNFFTYKCNAKLTARTLRFVFDFETLRDYVGPSEMQNFAADYKRVNDYIGLQLTYNTKANRSGVFSRSTGKLSPQTNRNIKVRLAIFFSLLTGIIIFFVARHRHRRSSENNARLL